MSVRLEGRKVRTEKLIDYFRGNANEFAMLQEHPVANCLRTIFPHNIPHKTDVTVGFQPAPSPTRKHLTC
ncbi:hypothetical protein [Paraburkholderia aromaticivorans]|uniref:hypothetical protein n=1 Tax=Paraburkholderia aromaticivorans TaxID=2026199 RepID=UPI0012FDD37A|nr:hypothetical protein [Paraburkholderia aromaticivorans]